MRKGKSLRRAVFGLLMISILVTARGNSQSTFGSIRGTTLDQTGSFLPETQVKLQNVDENTDFTASSDDHGNFAFENVKPGHYSLEASKEGFARAIVEKVELAARQDLRVDVKLSLASQNQVVEVSDAAALVNTENATLSDSKTN